MVDLTRALVELHVRGAYETGDLHLYRVGSQIGFPTRTVTDLKWGRTCGMHADIATVEVYLDGDLVYELPFHNCLAVEYAPNTATPAPATVWTCSICKDGADIPNGEFKCPSCGAELF